MKFSTFVRTISPYKWLAPVVEAIMRKYDWTRVMLVESSHHVWQVTSSDIQVRECVRQVRERLTGA